MVRFKRALIIVAACVAMVLCTLFLTSYGSKAAADGRGSYVAELEDYMKAGSSMQEAMQEVGFIDESSDDFPKWVRVLAGQEAENLYCTDDGAVVTFCISGDESVVLQDFEDRCADGGWEVFGDVESQTYVATSTDENVWLNVSWQKVGDGLSFVCNAS